MFSTDLYSEVLDAPAFVTLNVFPVTHVQTAVVFSFIAEQKSEAENAFSPDFLFENAVANLQLTSNVNIDAGSSINIAFRRRKPNG